MMLIALFNFLFLVFLGLIVFVVVPISLVVGLAKSFMHAAPKKCDDQ